MSKIISPKPAANQAFPFALLEEGLVKLDLDGARKAEKSADRVFPLLTRYIEEIELFNPAYGLVKVQDRRELIVKHILDSLAPLCVIRRLLDGMPHSADSGQKTSTIADVGSGSGLPGIPLAICMPDVNFTLVERMGRRAGFLRNVLAVLGIPNVRVEETEMEKFTSGASGFDLVVFRAFRPLEPAILKGLFRLVKPNGKLAAYKGRREAIEEEMAQAFKAAEKNLSPPIGAWEAVELEVPFLEEERHLLVMECPIAEAVGQVP